MPRIDTSTPVITGQLKYYSVDLPLSEADITDICAEVPANPYLNVTHSDGLLSGIGYPAAAAEAQDTDDLRLEPPIMWGASEEGLTGEEDLQLCILRITSLAVDDLRNEPELDFLDDNEYILAHHQPTTPITSGADGKRTRVLHWLAACAEAGTPIDEQSSHAAVLV